MDRRSFLRGTTATGIASVVAAAPALSDVHPVERLHALADEASSLMHHWDDKMGGRWELRVRADGDVMPVHFRNLRDHKRSPRDQALWHMMELERLLLENGAAAAMIVVSGMRYHGKSSRTVIHNTNQELWDEQGAFAV